MKLNVNNAVYEVEDGRSVLDIADDVFPMIRKKALAAMLDDEVISLATLIKGDHALAYLTFADEEGRKVFRHTASHILAQAILKLRPEAKLAIGPAINDGFYYDFDVEEPFTPDFLIQVEKEMSKIIKKNDRVERFELTKEEALKLVQNMNQPYKEVLINELPVDSIISFYRQGDFIDMCTGPHLLSTGRIKAFKLLRVAGAYWRGNEKNKMLQRIYGTAFDTTEELELYIAKLEDAKKRDHNKLGRELELFTTSEVIGQGLPIMLPKGARIMQILQRFVEDEEQRRGYLLTKTPYLAKSDLYKISGHWNIYYDGMFVLGNKEMDDAGEEVLALRPMTCPFQFQAYLNRLRSYRDLPLRYNETSTLFRNEASGEMHGLIRVRQFTISEGHLAVRPDQVEEEFKACLDLATYFLRTLGLLEDISFRFSKWDPNDRDKYIGDPQSWEQTQQLMRKILDDMQLSYVEAVGEAAFYGPKLDLQIKNVHGKEDTLITIQIDFQLAERFDMVYIDKDGEKRNPIVIHRTSIGCYERTLALLIEKYGGAFPLWLAPVQVKILTIADRADEFALELKRMLEAQSIRVELDLRNEKIGYKIREGQIEKVPYMLIIGDKEVENGNVAVRSRKEGIQNVMTTHELMNMINREITDRML